MILQQFHRYRQKRIQGRLKVTSCSETETAPRHQESSPLRRDEKVNGSEEIGWQLVRRHIVDQEGARAAQAARMKARRVGDHLDIDSLGAQDLPKRIVRISRYQKHAWSPSNLNPAPRYVVCLPQILGRHETHLVLVCS